jgi:hypothetical protein
MIANWVAPLRPCEKQSVLSIEHSIILFSCVTKALINLSGSLIFDLIVIV